MLLGILLALVLAEILLSVGALVVARGEMRPGTSPSPRSQRVVCVGDSNTYGVAVGPTEAYPARLQALLGDSAEVINLGYPGTSSSRLLADLPRFLDDLRPDVVLVLVGVNDFWTEPIRSSPDQWTAWLWNHSRVFRVFFLLGQQSRAPAALLEGAVPDGEAGVVPRRELATSDEELASDYRPSASGEPEWVERYPANVRAMAEIARERGVRLAMLTYASNQPPYGFLNGLIRSVSAKFALPLIDVQPRFAGLCDSATCPALLMSDGHPNANGYREFALAAVDQVRGLLPQAVGASAVEPDSQRPQLLTESNP